MGCWISLLKDSPILNALVSGGALGKQKNNDESGEHLKDVFLLKLTP